jgi:hypothetical protein
MAETGSGAKRDSFRKIVTRPKLRALQIPVTGRAARRVGDILKHVPSDKKVNSRFRYFT